MLFILLENLVLIFKNLTIIEKNPIKIWYWAI